MSMRPVMRACNNKGVRREEEWDNGNVMYEKHPLPPRGFPTLATVM